MIVVAVMPLFVSCHHAVVVVDSIMIDALPLVEHYDFEHALDSYYSVGVVALEVLVVVAAVVSFAFVVNSLLDVPLALD